MAPHLKSHKGRACVFTSADDMLARIDDPNLDVDQNSILVLQNIGPVGHPGMPEAGYTPIPKKLARAGVRDMLRISDGRMSGTASGAVILHVAPEAAVGGPLAAVRDGDMIHVDVEARRLHLDVGDDESARRLEEWKTQPPPRPTSTLHLNLCVALFIRSQDIPGGTPCLTLLSQDPLYIGVLSLICNMVH
ncbi:hypothetical protein CspHIS471_0303000 [Cutaneotrichosporon sp. HIS471]|nr:hypothetical protein CspHIS471_0303000 [Cutaneotrichosporon sp. HIS471]